MFRFRRGLLKWFGRASRSSTGVGREVCRAALLASVLSAAICGATPSLARSGVPDRTEDRLVIGVVKLLSGPLDRSRAVLEALATKHAEVLEPGDDFWPKTVDAIMSRQEVREALEKRVKSNFSENRDSYARLTQQLPALADALAITLSFDDGGTVDGKPVDEILRRMRTAPTTAQRALIARTIDPSNGASGELLEHIASFPDIVAGAENYVLGLRSLGNAKARNLAFRYALARGLEVTGAELSGALDGSDQETLRAALARVSSLPPDRVRTFAPALKKIVEQAGDPSIWAESLRLLLIVDPDAATRIIDTHLRDVSFWVSDRGYTALNTMTAAPGSLAVVRARIADLPLKQMIAHGRCDALLAAAVLWLDLDAAYTATSLTSMLSNIAKSQNGPPCSVETVAKSLDAATTRLGIAGAKAYASALSRQAPPAAADAGIESVRDLLQHAPETRRALASDPGTLVELARRANPDPLVAALVEALPSDDPILSELRRTFQPDEKESLTDHIQRNKETILTVLRLTDRPNGWSDRDMGLLVSLSSSEADVDVSRRAFDVLVHTEHVQGLVDIFDATVRGRITPSDTPDEPTIRAFRAFARASAVSRDRASLFSQERIGWLLERFPVEGLRGRVIRALGLRPDSVSIDPDKFASLLPRAVPSKHGTTTGVCADAATLGPFSDGRLAIESLELSAAQSYQDEDWVPACVAWLAPSKSAGLTEQGEMLWLLSLRDGTLAAQDEPSKQLKTLFELWSASKTDAVGDLPRRMASRAGALAPHVGWNLADTKLLWEWDSELSRRMPDQVWPVRRAWLVRAGLLLLLAIPAIVIVHLTFWGILLVAYRKSKRVQTHVFYNPLARKILGLGYVDILLVWIGPLRRLLFAPFADGMLGELGRVSLGTKEGPYYPSSHVIKLNLSDVIVDLKEAETAALSGRLKIAPEPIVSSLAVWKGPTCLFGPSGRGKTSYLRHVLATNAATRTPFVYLRAWECGEDLASTVCDRFPGLGRDTDLILSLIQSGLLDIYVDGLNEVDRALQEKIVQFIVGHPTANIFVTSQEVGISLPRKLATYYLLPLTKDQMREFLLGREPTLDAKAPIRGENYARSIDIFLDRLSEEVVGSPQPGAATSSSDRAILTSFIATLANPMDLDTAAVLLSLDIDPDPFRLREQQFRLVDEDCQADLRRPFPISAFSKSALEARENGKPEIDTTAFGEYVAIMEQRKQVRRISLKTASGYVAEYDFRHEKVSDFYLHFALLEADSTKRFELAGNDRFAGLYDYLARELPLDAANELKEYLLSSALDSNDHRLSDRFLQHLRWRALFGRDDPPWLGRYDTPESYAAVDEFDRLAALRDGTEAEMRAARSVIEASRAGSRILAAKDAQSLESLVRDLFVKKGAHEIPTPGGAAPLFEIPGFGSLALLCAAGQRALSAVTRGGLISRASRIAERKLVVVNPQPELDPMDRDWSQVEEWARILTSKDVRVLETRVLFRFARAEDDFADRSFWPKVMQSADPMSDTLMRVNGGSR